MLGEAIDKGVPPPEEFEPDVLLRGNVHLIFAPGGAAKTWMALWLIARALGRGERVLYYDGENGKRVISGRLEELGVSGADAERLLHYVPHSPLTLASEDVLRHRYLLDGFKPGLVVFDSLLNHLSASGLDENSPTDVARWATAYTHPAKKHGMTSVVLDHVGHEAADRPRGSSRKGDEADVLWKLQKRKPFSRDQVGEVTLVRTKDRESWLPSSVTFSVGGSPSGFVFERSLGTVEEREAPDRLLRSERAVLDALQECGAAGATDTLWKRAAAGAPHEVSRSAFYRAKKELLDRGKVVEKGGVFGVIQPPTKPRDGGLTDAFSGEVVSSRDETSTTGSGVTKSRERGTNANGMDKTETNPSPIRSPGSPRPGMRPREHEVPQVSPPFRGETVGQAPETSGTGSESTEPGAAPDTAHERADGGKNHPGAIEGPGGSSTDDDEDEYTVYTF